MEIDHPLLNLAVDGNGSVRYKEHMETPWDEARVRRLMVLWSGGFGASDIGRLLGVSRNAVIGKARRLGLKARGSPLGGVGAREATKRARAAMERGVPA